MTDVHTDDDEHSISFPDKMFIAAIFSAVGPALRAADPVFDARLGRDFSGSSLTSDLEIGTPVATLPGTWHYRVSVGTGWPGISIL